MCLISLPPTPFLLVILFHLPQPLLGRLLLGRVPLPGLLGSLAGVRLRGGMFEMWSVTWRASLASPLLMCPGTPLVNRGVHTYPCCVIFLSLRGLRSLLMGRPAARGTFRLY